MTEDIIEGQRAHPAYAVSGAFQDYNDPPPDSPFEKVNDETNRCKACGQLVYNNTESRDGHFYQDAGKKPVDG